MSKFSYKVNNGMTMVHVEFGPYSYRILTLRVQYPVPEDSANIPGL